MATLGDLMAQFDAAADDGSEKTAAPAIEETTVIDDGETKTASGGEGMKSLTDIYLALTESDFEKEAEAAAQVPDADFAKMAEQLAEAEAEDIVAADGEEVDMVKVAKEYDAAGRIMARGFYEEFNKLAGNMDTDVTPNQNTEAESAAQTPALGERGLPTVPTNYAGSPENDKPIETTGPGPKQVHAKVLEEKRKVKAGVTGDNPFATAASLSGGALGGHAQQTDLANGKPA